MLKIMSLATAILVICIPAKAETIERGTKIEIVTAIDLSVPAEIVWQVLADTEAYSEWNPYHVRVQGTLALGERLVVDIEKPNGNCLTIEPHVLELEPHRSLVWGGGPVGIFRGVHRFDLERLTPQCTRLHHTEVFSGLFVSFAELGSIESGYQMMNAALKVKLDELGYLSGDVCPVAAL